MSRSRVPRLPPELRMGGAGAVKHGGKVEIPPLVAAERDRAYAGPAPGFGDPRPGRSALDQRKESTA